MTQRNANQKARNAMSLREIYDGVILLNYWICNCSVREAGTKLDCSASTINSITKKYGIAKKPDRGQSPKDFPEAYELMQMAVERVMEADESFLVLIGEKAT